MRLLNYMLIGALLTACGIAEDSQVAEPPTTSTMPLPSTTMTELISTTTLPDGVTPGLLEQIVADASARTGVQESDIRVVSVEAMTFSDTSLGCPELGKMYAQVMTPGFVVLIEAGGEQLDYRVAERAETFGLCD